LNLTKRALNLDPVNDAYAYFFSAIAYFNLNPLPEAQYRALKPEAIDRDQHEPLVQYLLAQTYEAEHDSAALLDTFGNTRSLRRVRRVQAMSSRICAQLGTEARFNARSFVAIRANCYGAPA
jgi:cytochrome c-type biogenesis protein CcmH/NrfG